ncbi:MAG TPA: DUF1127 domain-containing protein [Vineibacter sp.]|nr:DUF1127 domain-containing protein [Vineibacter sp.]
MAFMADTFTGTSSTVAHGFGGVIKLPATAFGWWLRRLEVARSRQALLGLDDRMLADVGLDRATAFNEGEKGFWR